jgi:hypothetical protein
VLGRVGRGSYNPANDSRPWVRFILTAHLRQARTMLVRVRETERLWVDLEQVVTGPGLPDRVILVLFDAATGMRVRNATYRASLEESGRIRRDDRSFIRQGMRAVCAGRRPARRV